MRKVILSKFAAASNVHPTLQKQAALKIEEPKEPRKNRDQYATVSIDGTNIWLTYQWQYDTNGELIIYVKNAKFPAKKHNR